MTIKLVYGAPGSGKSYHMAKTLAEMLCDWARVEKQTGERYPRKLYTNLPLIRSAYKDYVERKTGVEFDVDYYLVETTDAFFGEPSQLRDENGRFLEDEQGKPVWEFWWDRIPDDALIVLDEAHNHLGVEYAYVNKIETFRAMRKYFSQHRHRRHDWILITQAKNNLSNQILVLCEQAIHVFNAKTLTLPFPISIPMEDIETLLKGFGVKNQVYRIRVGTYNDRRVVFDGPIQAFTMTAEIFALYKSNTMAADKIDVVGDRALPFKGPIGGILWFAKRHVPHLAVKAGAVFFVWSFFSDVVLSPDFMMGDASTNKPQPIKKQAVKTVKNSNVNDAPPQEAVITSDIKEVAPVLEPTQPVLEPEPVLEVAPKAPQLDKTPDLAIVGFFPDRILSKDGSTYRIGETATLGVDNDDKEVVQSLEKINVKRREALFAGPYLWTRKGFSPPLRVEEQEREEEPQNAGSAEFSDDRGVIDPIRDGLPLGGVLASGTGSGENGVRNDANSPNTRDTSKRRQTDVQL